MDSLLKSRIKKSLESSKIAGLFGLKIISMNSGYLEIEMNKKDFMLRPAGMFNGSSISSLVDISSGYAGATANLIDTYFTTVDLKLSFINPAIGDKLIALSKVVKNGKNLVFIQTDVINQNNVLVANAQATLMKLNKQSKSIQID